MVNVKQKLSSTHQRLSLKSASIIWLECANLWKSEILWCVANVVKRGRKCWFVDRNWQYEKCFYSNLNPSPLNPIDCLRIWAWNYRGRFNYKPSNFQFGFYNNKCGMTVEQGFELWHHQRSTQVSLLNTGCICFFHPPGCTCRWAVTTVCGHTFGSSCLRSCLLTQLQKCSYHHRSWFCCVDIWVTPPPPPLSPPPPPWEQKKGLVVGLKKKISTCLTTTMPEHLLPHMLQCSRVMW